MKSFMKGAAVTAAALCCWAGAASAHEFRCEKTVNGGVVYDIKSYPATLHYEITVTNTHPSLPSTALKASDSLMKQLGLTYTPEAPFTLKVGESVTTKYDVGIKSREACLRIGDGKGEIENFFNIAWDLGHTSCSAVVNCGPPPCTGETCNEGGATRTMGFFKTHETALTACLAEGAIKLGFVKISTLAAAEGLLWGSPSFYSAGGKRTKYDATQFRLARQTLVGICNQRLFGTATDPADLLAQAVAALSGTNCADMNRLEGLVDAYNNSGDEEPFPKGFDPGPATPKHAESIAVDPTSHSTKVCD